MNFIDLSSLSFVYLYAGDVPDRPVYRDKKIIGLSFIKDDQWHIHHDITKPFPIPDGSVDVFQAEDVFEHIVFEKLFAVVQEIFRVLKVGGLFRLSVPDYRCDVLYNRALRDSAGNILYDPLIPNGLKNSLRKIRFKIFGGTRKVNGGHVWFPKFETVRELLKNNRFSSVEFLHKGFIQRTPDYDESVSSPYRPISLVVDCVK